ncbi:hypothetical protein [Rufibacter tibetensis]|uniref:Uncharacterized protein n=1 Tax=Rufibacter tibetensis TaxID=512763 RepID=A0A0P0C1D8_9BACT|nr:hypothetical protein [Rufibacter tibetensis]ALI98663.1 hypothetical protein DC20_06395 [Rufibacter tibetensis]
MKTKSLLFLLFLLLVKTTTFSQVAPPPPAKDYAKRATSLTTAGVLSLIGGALLGVASAVTFEFGVTEKVNNNDSAILGVASLSALIGGTCLLIAGKHNRKKAKSIKLKQGQTFLPNQGSLMSKAVPTIGVQIAF